MPLINLQTNLKSLSYNGNGPYIEKDINNPGRPASEYIQGRVDDTTRMLRLLGDKGIAFTSKQALLLAGTKGLAAIPQAGNILLNIIAQVPVNGTGTHFLPIDRNLYYTGVTDAAERSLQGGMIGGAYREGRAFNTATRLLDQQSELGDITENLDYVYINPKQYLNVGATTDLTFKPNQERTAPTPAVTTVQLNQIKPIGAKNTPIVIREFNGQDTLDTKYGFAETGKPDTVGTQDVNNETLSDSVPIKFTLYNGTNVTATLVFRGFIDSFSDDMSGNWESLRYIGRAEEMYTYGGFSRGINLNFQVPVLSSQEQTPTLNKINALKSAVLPQYKNDLPIATFCKLRIGDLIADDTTYVVLNSVNHSLDTDVPWSVGSDEKLLPQLYKLSISMKVLHKNIPQVWDPTIGRQFIGHNV